MNSDGTAVKQTTALVGICDTGRLLTRPIPWSSCCNGRRNQYHFLPPPTSRHDLLLLLMRGNNRQKWPVVVALRLSPAFG